MRYIAAVGQRRLLPRLKQFSSNGRWTGRENSGEKGTPLKKETEYIENRNEDTESIGV